MPAPTAIWAIIDDRRRKVAALRLRKLSLREIEKKLAEEGVVNPNTGKPWGLGTIARDMEALEHQWRREAAADVAQLKALELAEINEVKRSCWGLGRPDLVLDAIALEAKIGGTLAPLRREHSGPGGGPIVTTNLAGLNDDELAAILSNLQAAGGAGGSGPAGAAPAGDRQPGEAGPAVVDDPAPAAADAGPGV